jgi:hypothetical protein
LGAREGNRLLADGNGRPRLGLMFGVKAGLCGITALAQEKHLFGRDRARLTEPLWTGMNASLTLRFSLLAIHNRGVVEQMRQRAASTPAYLTPAP